MKKTYYTLVAFVASSLVSAAAYAQSCPMCKESMTQEGQRLSEGFYQSIMEMAFLPMVLVGTVSVFVVRASYMKKHPDSNLSTFGIFREYIKERRANRG
jgi:hypothetical protein